MPMISVSLIYFNQTEVNLLYISGLQKEDLRPHEEIVREKLLQVLESAYPNVLSVEDLMRYITLYLLS